MASVEAPPHAEARASASSTAGRPPAWSLPSGLLLIVCLMVAGFAAVASVVIPLLGRTNGTDWLLYFSTVAVLLPGAFACGRWLAATADSAGGSGAVAVLGAWAAVGLLAAGIIARIAYSLGGSSSSALLPLLAVWGAAVAWAARSRGPRTRRVELLVSDPRRAYKLAAALACACGLAFLSPELFRPAELAASLAIAGVLTVVHLRLESWGRSRRAARVLDAVVVALVILVVTDVSGYIEYLRPDAPSYLMGDGLVVAPEALAFSHRLHEGFWLGPINDMLGGRPMLVDTWSQYGVGVFYFLAAFFQVAPLGYGALGLLVGFLTALQYSLAYVVLRIAGCARTLAIPATAAAVLGLVLGSIGSPDDFPATGALRFGIPWLVVALAVLATRAGRREQLCLAAATALVAVASIWSFETFLYTAAAFVSAVGFRAAAMAPGTPRARAFARSVLQAGAGCVLAHALLALGVRFFAGSWPDWSPYLAFLKVYSGSDLYVYAVAPWSPGLLVALVYLASAICLAGLLARRHIAVDEHRPALMAIAATSGLGLSSFAYFVGHSHPNTLVLVSLPAVVVGCLWVAFLGDGGAWAPRAIAIAAVAAGLFVAALIGVSGWPDATAKWRRTALANVLPDGGQTGSIRYAVRRLWRSPPSDPRATQAQALLDRHLPRGAPALVLVEPDLTLETLVRSGRVNVLPISDPEEENLVPEQADPRVLRTIERLRPGMLMLAQPATFDAPTKPKGAYVPGRLLRLQKLAIDRIRVRFRLREVERGPSGLVIVRLVARR